MSGKNFFSKNIQRKQKFKRLYLSAMHLRDVQFLIGWSNSGRDLMLSMSRRNDQIIVKYNQIFLLDWFSKHWLNVLHLHLQFHCLDNPAWSTSIFHRRTNEKKKKISLEKQSLSDRILVQSFRSLCTYFTRLKKKNFQCLLNRISANDFSEKRNSTLFVRSALYQLLQCFHQ